MCQLLQFNFLWFDEIDFTLELIVIESQVDDRLRIFPSRFIILQLNHTVFINHENASGYFFNISISKRIIISEDWTAFLLRISVMNCLNSSCIVSVCEGSCYQRNFDLGIEAWTMEESWGELLLFPCIYHKEMF